MSNKRVFKRKNGVSEVANVEIVGSTPILATEVELVVVYVSPRARHMEVGYSSRPPVVPIQEQQQELIPNLATDIHLIKKVIKERNKQLMELIKEQVESE